MNNPLDYFKISQHNKSVFKNNLIYSNKKKKIILLEFNRLSSSIISYSYLANILQKKYNSEIFAYRLTAKKNKLKDLLWKIFSKIKIFNTFQVYDSFGTKSFINPQSTYLKPQYLKKIKNIKKNINSKNDLLNLKIDKIYIGDLIYDSYLMNYKKPTIDLNDRSFTFFLDHSLKTFFQWKEIFKKYDVKSVIVSHSVYTLAIPLRIAIHKNISAFQCSSQHIYRLSKKNIYAYREFFYYNKLFRKLDSKTKIKAIKLAKEKIKNKFEGKGLALGSSKSAYRNIKYKNILHKNNKTKILIATHCFFDNPHPYGKNLFVDFYEWLNFLGNLSVKTKYEWYIKLHPDYLPETKKIISDFLIKFPNIKYIPSKYSHHQLIKEGINVALTSWGSIAHEYPLFNKLVINSSLNNPHISYNFSLHPKSVKEYEKLLLNLSLKKKIAKKNKKSIIEFYAMNFVLKKNWMIDSFDKIISSRDYGYYYIFKSDFYNFWIKKEFNKHKHDKILKNILKFLDSNDYLMGWNMKDLNKFLYVK